MNDLYDSRLFASLDFVCTDYLDEAVPWAFQIVDGYDWLICAEDFKTGGRGGAGSEEMDQLWQAIVSEELPLTRRRRAMLQPELGIERGHGYSTVYLRAPGSFSRVYPLLQTADFFMWGYEGEIGDIEAEQNHTLYPGNGWRPPAMTHADLFFGSYEAFLCFAAPLDSNLVPVSAHLDRTGIKYTRSLLGEFLVRASGGG